MKIRDHPNLVHWPPAWIEPLDYGFVPFNESEEFVLKEVELLSSFPNDYHSYIRISAEYGHKMGKFFGGTKTKKTYSSMIIFMKRQMRILKRSGPLSKNIIEIMNFFE